MQKTNKILMSLLLTLAVLGLGVPAASASVDSSWVCCRPPAVAQ